MLARALRTRAVARLAVAALSLGLFALAGLALWSTDRTARDTARLGELNEIANQWGALFETLNVQDASVDDYVRAGDEVGRRPLESAIGLGSRELDWLRAHSEPDRRVEVTLVAEAHESYTTMLAQLVALGQRGDQAGVLRRAKAASLMADTLRKQLSANIASRRLEIAAYLQDAKRFNNRLKVAAGGVFSVDVVLLLLCAAVLLSHQRRVERQAAESGHRAQHDALTGLANRALLSERVDDAVRAAGPSGAAVALLLVDLDRFKEVNDTLGHHVGDLLLQCVAARLAGAVRERDTVARLGGDEFAVLLPTVGGVAEAERLAKRLLHTLQQPVELDGITVDVGGSIGVGLYPDHCADTRQLFQHADLAMYTAKRARLGTAVYCPDGNDIGAQQRTLLGELRRAIDRGEILLHYQPQLDARTGTACGVAALVRWQHPDHGLLLPEEFLPLAEQSGLGERLTRYVVTAAVNQCHRWRSDGWSLPMTVSAAAGCLRDPAFAGFVLDLLADRGLPPGTLTLEFGEAVFLSDAPGVLNVLAVLRDRGVRICFAGFGAAGAIPAFLRTLPVDELKVPVTEAASGSAVEVGHRLGLRVVAVGVDEEDTWAEARAAGYDVGQGHWLGIPVPPHDLAERLAAGALTPVDGAH